jgi:FKBP-type peptidyl-prolyl cis-trans isomerase
MVVRCSRILIAGAVTALLGLAGCEGLKDPVPPPDPIPTVKPETPPQGAPVSKDLKPKQAELPKLPEGAGSMDDDAPDELTPTASGLYYRILRKSDGVKPKATNTVLAHYQGWVDSGKTFDSSYERKEPAEFPLSGVIRGWTEGLQLLGKGGMIELEIPGYLGYPEGRPPHIQPNATLHFIVELVEVK